MKLPWTRFGVRHAAATLDPAPFQTLKASVLGYDGALDTKGLVCRITPKPVDGALQLRDPVTNWDDFLGPKRSCYIFIISLPVPPGGSPLVI